MSRVQDQSDAEIHERRALFARAQHAFPDAHFSRRCFYVDTPLEELRAQVARHERYSARAGITKRITAAKPQPSPQFRVEKPRAAAPASKKETPTMTRTELEALVAKNEAAIARLKRDVAAGGTASGLAVTNRSGRGSELSARMLAGKMEHRATYDAKTRTLSCGAVLVS